jgi:tripartite-type tricarboxylate transporter receptor subunit TctC
MRRMLFAAALAAVLAGATGAMAQTYPSRPITMVVPLGVGGSTDVIARIMAEGMRASLGQPVIVENTTGAGGTIGVGRVARAAPDGYTSASVNGAPTSRAAPSTRCSTTSSRISNRSR